MKLRTEFSVQADALFIELLRNNYDVISLDETTLEVTSQRYNITSHRWGQMLKDRVLEIASKYDAHQVEE